MPATFVSAVENYIPMDEQKNRRRFQRPQGKSHWMKNKDRKREGERERGVGRRGETGKKWNGWTSESASSRDRAETRWNGWAITLPGEPCLTLFRCLLSSCSRPPVCVHPSLLDPPASISRERTAAIQPSLDYNRALTSRSTVRSPSSRTFRLTPWGDPRANRSGAWTRWIINRVPLSMANRE